MRIRDAPQWLRRPPAATVGPMTTRWPDTRGNQACSLAAEPFNVVLVYEDPASAQRGLTLYQRLMSELGIACEFNLGVWKFAVLALARLDELTREQAAAADLVIVCLQAAPEPPEQVHAWFQHWLDVKGDSDCALVVLDQAGHAQPECAGRGGCFHRLARRGGDAFFPTVSAADGPATRADGRGRFARLGRTPGVDGWLAPHAAGNHPSSNPWPS